MRDFFINGKNVLTFTSGYLPTHQGDFATSQMGVLQPYTVDAFLIENPDLRFTSSRENQWYRLMQRQLKNKGFLNEDGIVIPIEDAKRGKAFIQSILKFVPLGWDLIDILDQELPEGVRLDFGDTLDIKNVNGSLRSLGMYRKERPEEGQFRANKWIALNHPFRNRLNKVKMAIEQMDRLLEEVRQCEGRDINEELRRGIYKEKGNLEKWIPRLEVEVFVVELYLERDSWLSNVLKDESIDVEQMKRELRNLIFDMRDTFSLYEEISQELRHYF